MASGFWLVTYLAIEDSNGKREFLHARRNHGIPCRQLLYFFFVSFVPLFPIFSFVAILEFCQTFKQFITSKNPDTDKGMRVLEMEEKIPTAFSYFTCDQRLRGEETD